MNKPKIMLIIVLALITMPLWINGLIWLLNQPNSILNWLAIILIVLIVYLIINKLLKTK